MSESFMPDSTDGYTWLIRYEYEVEPLMNGLYQSGLSPSLAAEKLTEQAINEGLVQRRSPPKGTTLQDWINKKQRPYVGVFIGL